MSILHHAWLTLALASPACSLIAEPPPVAFDQEISFPAEDGVVIGATLNVPQGKGPHPAVLLIGGAAERDRDQVIVGFATLRTLAEQLGKAGVATLRYDDRGTGATGGSLERATPALLAADAQRALDALRGATGIDPRRVGLLGHGEGGIVAAAVAAQRQDVAFVVLMAGICIPMEQMWLDTYEAELKLRQAPQKRLEDGRRAVRWLFAAVRAGNDVTPAAQALQQLAEQDFAALDEAQRRKIGSAADLFDASFEGRLAQQAGSERFRHHLDIDPTPDLNRLRVPILALFGERDLTVNAARHGQALQQATASAGKDAVRIHILAGANHLFQKADTGTPAEYSTLEKNYLAGFVDLIATFVRAQKPRMGG